MGLSRDQEKAMFAGAGKPGKGIRKKQIVTSKKINFKPRFRMDMLTEREDNFGRSLWNSLTEDEKIKIALKAAERIPEDKRYEEAHIKEKVPGVFWDNLFPEEKKSIVDTVGMRFKKESKQKVAGKNLISEIIYLAEIDDGNPHSEDSQIVSMYNKLSSDNKKVADNFMIYITGYGLDTIIKTAEAKGRTISGEMQETHWSDEENVESESRSLYDYYKGLSPSQKKIMNELSTRLTGYEIGSILSGNTISGSKTRPVDWNQEPRERRPDY